MEKIKYSKYKEEYESLLKQLQREQCVLLIGPELLKVQGEPFQHIIQEQIRAKFPDKIPFYYQKDALYVFKDETAKAKIQEKVRDKLDEISDLNQADNKPDESIFQKIAALPFHLILSVNPDHYLSDVFSKYGVRHRMAYFHHSGSGVEKIEEPHDYMPLIYNLFGSKDKDASLVLDYDDLFSLFKTMLGHPGLPTKLESKLVEAKSFLFLGFRFDRWYSQLLLRLLSGKRAISKFVLETNPDPDTCIFLASQLGINLLGNDLRFFDLLYKLCKSENGLRELVNIGNPSAQTIFQLIQKGDIGRAMQLIENLSKGKPWENDAIHLLSRYHMWEKNRNQGIQDERDAQVEMNQILYAALQLVSQNN